MKHIIFLSLIFLITIFCLPTFSPIFAQLNSSKPLDSLKTSTINSNNAIQTEEGDIKIKDGSNNTLLRITDEGNFGAIEIKPGVPSTTSNKLYNDGGTLKFNGTNLGGGSATNEINDLDDAKYDGTSLFVGENAGANDDGTTNFNVALGKNALNSNTTGFHNTALGYSSLSSNLNADSNVAIGYNALSANINGNQNTAVGTNALLSIRNSGNNTAVGASALHGSIEGTNNTSVGYNSMWTNSTGINNVSIGSSTDFYNLKGSNNTIVGYKAGHGTNSHTKSGNIFLGYTAGFNELGSNKLYIENSNSAFPLIWGDFLADSIIVNGGLEVTSKTKTPLLQVTTGATDGYVLTSDAAGNATWQELSGGGGSGDVDWTISGDDIFSTQSGNVGIGTSSPASKLSVGGNGNPSSAFYSQNDNFAVYGITTNEFNSSAIYGLASYAGSAFTKGGFFQSNATAGTGASGVANSDFATGISGEANGTNGTGVKGTAEGTGGVGVEGDGVSFDFDATGPGVNYGATSSKRWKNNIVNISDPIGKINQIRGVYFDWDKDHGGGHDVGCIAEEIGSVFPEIVVFEDNGIDARGMDYSKLTPVLIEAVKELSKENLLLKNSNSKLTERIERIEELLRN